MLKQITLIISVLTLLLTLNISPARADFFENFDVNPPGNPPKVFDSSNWDLILHARDGYENVSLSGGKLPAHHGSDCAAPIGSVDGNPVLITHDIIVNSGGNTNLAKVPEMFYTCRNHMMSAINGGGYYLAVFTPNHMVDFTNGEAVVKIDSSTFRSSARDWWDIWITPFSDNLPLPFNDIGVDFQGHPKNALHINMQFDALSRFHLNVFTNMNQTISQSQRTDAGYETVIKPDAARRDTFELRISRTHIKFCLVSANYSTAAPGPNGETTPKPLNLCWIDRDIPQLAWTQGVVQFGHHGYTPDKNDGTSRPPHGLVPYPENNTWHWDNVSISPSKPFTIIKANNWIARSGSPDLTFASPAPANSFLRFSGLGVIDVSFNSGSTWQRATKQAQQGVGNSQYHAEHESGYWMAIPTGTDKVRFRFSKDDWFDGSCCSGLGFLAKDVTIWSQGTPSTTPTSTPTQAVASPTPLPTSVQATPTSITRKPGDCQPSPNGDGDVDIFDYNALVGNFGSTSNLACDFVNPGAIDIFDYNTLVGAFGT